MIQVCGSLLCIKEVWFPQKNKGRNEMSSQSPALHRRLWYSEHPGYWLFPPPPLDPTPLQRAPRILSGFISYWYFITIGSVSFEKIPKQKYTIDSKHFSTLFLKIVWTWYCVMPKLVIIVQSSLRLPNFVLNFLHHKFVIIRFGCLPKAQCIFTWQYLISPQCITFKVQRGKF